MLSTSFITKDGNLTNSTISSTKDKDSTLIWNTDRKLIWDDFLGKADKHSGYAALTSSKIGFDTEWFDDSVIVIIPTYFDHHKSWVLGDGTDELLAHEQGHFDIAEIIARKVRKELSFQKFTDITMTSKKINTIYKKHTQHSWSSYDKYDQETKHGTVKSKQKDWLERISGELKELDKFDSDTIVIRRK